MPPHEDANRPADASGVDDRRHAVRLPQDALLQCNQGEILDLSKTGMRLRHKGTPRETIIPLLLSDGREQLILSGQIMWQKKTGFRTYELGIHFVDPRPEDLAAISRFAMYNRFMRSM